MKGFERQINRLMDLTQYQVIKPNSFQSLCLYANPYAYTDAYPGYHSHVLTPNHDLGGAGGEDEGNAREVPLDHPRPGVHQCQLLVVEQPSDADG